MCIDGVRHLSASTFRDASEPVPTVALCFLFSLPLCVPGASDLMDPRVAQPILERIYRAAQRVDSAGALDTVLAAEAK